MRCLHLWPHLSWDNFALEGPYRGIFLAIAVFGDPKLGNPVCCALHTPCLPILLIFVGTSSRRRHHSSCDPSRLRSFAFEMFRLYLCSDFLCCKLYKLSQKCSSLQRNFPYSGLANIDVGALACVHIGLIFVVAVVPLAVSLFLWRTFPYARIAPVRTHPGILQPWHWDLWKERLS